MNLLIVKNELIAKEYEDILVKIAQKNELCKSFDQKLREKDKIHQEMVENEERLNEKIDELKMNVESQERKY